VKAALKVARLVAALTPGSDRDGQRAFAARRAPALDFDLSGSLIYRA
jgi:hypothetical protein